MNHALLRQTYLASIFRLIKNVEINNAYSIIKCSSRRTKYTKFNPSNENPSRKKGDPYRIGIISATVQNLNIVLRFLAMIEKIRLDDKMTVAGPIKEAV